MKASNTPPIQFVFIMYAHSITIRIRCRRCRRVHRVLQIRAGNVAALFRRL